MKLNRDYFYNKVYRYHREGVFYRDYRVPEWDVNHQLYYIKSETNEAQRQPVCASTTKEAVNVTLSNMADSPEVYFIEKDKKIEFVKGKETLDNAHEIVVNSCWESWVKDQNIQLKDASGKKNACLYGRDIKMLDICNGKITIEVISPYNIIVDRFASVYDLQDANFVERTGIKSTIYDIKANPNYDKKAVKELIKNFTSDNDGVVTDAGFRQRQITSENDTYQEDMHHENVGDSYVSSTWVGETIIELNEAFYKMVDPDALAQTIKNMRSDGNNSEADQIEADGFCWWSIVHHRQLYFLQISPVILTRKVNRNLLDSWAYDLEDGFFWSYGVADDVRSNNLISNTYLSQWLENRAFANYNMHYYNSEYDDFNPMSYDPAPGAYLPVPGDPNTFLRPADIRGLEENLKVLEYFDQSSQRASAATALQMGIKEPGEQTLGQTQMLNSNALARLTPMKKYYKLHWERIATLWLELLTANADSLDVFKTSKRGENGQIFKRDIAPKEVKGDFYIEVSTRTDKRQKDIETVQLLEYLSSRLPSKIAQQEIASRLVGLMEDLSAEKKKDIIRELSSKENPLNNQQIMAGNITAGLPQGDKAGIPSVLAPQAGQQ